MSGLLKNNAAVYLAVGVLSIVYVLFGYLPNQKAAGHARREIESKQQQIEQARRLAAALPAMQQELDATRGYNQAWESRLPKLEAVSGVFAQICDLAKAAEVTTTRFDPEPPVRLQQLSQVPLTVALRGTFASVHDFLARLERAKAVVWVDSLKYSPGGKADGTVDAEINLVVFAKNSDASDYANLSEQPIQ